MTRLLIILTVGIFSCRQPLQENKKVIDKPAIVDNKKSNLPIIGDEIQGDFFGNGKVDTARVVKIKEGHGNPVEDGTADEYEIRFLGDKLKSINVGCCDVRLINEGDLNNDKVDEISIFQAPINGCTYSMMTYSFINGTWKQIVAPFLIPTGCDNISDGDLQKRIFKENDSIYYYDTDMSDESEKLVKKKITTNE